MIDIYPLYWTTNKDGTYQIRETIFLLSYYYKIEIFIDFLQSLYAILWIVFIYEIPPLS